MLLQFKDRVSLNVFLLQDTNKNLGDVILEFFFSWVDFITEGPSLWVLATNEIGIHAKTNFCGLGQISGNPLLFREYL